MAYQHTQEECQTLKAEQEAREQREVSAKVKTISFILSQRWFLAFIYSRVTGFNGIRQFCFVIAPDCGDMLETSDLPLKFPWMMCLCE